MKIHLIAAARPNFMKIAPLYHALKKEDWTDPTIVHTGQHYDLNMSDAFFKDLNLPEPDIHLGIGSGSHAEQTGNVMIAYEKVLLEHQPDMVIVVGDVNSTIACILAATKVTYNSSGESSQFHPEIEKSVKSNKSCESCQPKKDRLNPFQKSINSNRPLVAHLEAGLRSFDRTMPEEINRIVTDSLADILWTPSPDADENLLREGVPHEKIVRVGNIMIDSLEMLRNKIEKQAVYKEFNVNKNAYGLITLHRPSNVDSPEVLSSICDVFINISKKLPLIFPVHPRTRKKLFDFGLKDRMEEATSIFMIEPINYIRFMNLVFNCKVAITDSGGIQEETTYIGIPCLTMRLNTERPITVTHGKNRLCKVDNLEDNLETVISGKDGKLSVPELWDGQTASRVVQSIKSFKP